MFIANVLIFSVVRYVAKVLIKKLNFASILFIRLLLIMD